MNFSDINSFYLNFSQQIIFKSDVEEEESMRESTFTSLMIDYLQEAGEAEDGIICNHFNKRLGTKLNAYYINDEGSSIDLFVSVFKAEQEPVIVSLAEAEAALERAKRFLSRSLIKNYYINIDEAHGEYDIAYFLSHYKDQIENIRIILLSNGIIKPFVIESHDIGEINVSFQVWDIDRLFRLISSGKRREEIEVDILEISGMSIPCILTHIPNGRYDSCLASIPGEVLVAIYEKFGSRLLERNVRTFLQLRGNVNKGIRNTLINTPEMFLAYNNGISATAADIEFEDEGNNILKIKKIRDLQIVNGGQTTASLFYASKKKNKKQASVDLSQVYVQAKITIIKDTEKMDAIVPNISLFANSQNRIQMADFSANDPYHRKIEELSRTVWAPAKGGGERQSKWFYERMRGQYDDNRSMAQSAKVFLSEYPPKQKFDKTDLSKYENCWDMLPHIVSKGKQDSFKHFTLRLTKVQIMPDQKYFEHLIAKKILFTHIYDEVTSQFGVAARANIIAYTFSYLAYKTANRIDLDTIWINQSIPKSLAIEIEKLIPYINEFLRETAEDRLVTQWAKQEDCWKALKERNIPLLYTKDYTIVRGDLSGQKVQSGIEMNTDSDNRMIKIVSMLPCEIWMQISAWAKDTNNLQTWQRQIAFSIGKRISSGKEPTAKQAKQGLIILKEAVSRGFVIEDNVVGELDNIEVG